VKQPGRAATDCTPRTPSLLSLVILAAKPGVSARSKRTPVGTRDTHDTHVPYKVQMDTHRHITHAPVVDHTHEPQETSHDGSRRLSPRRGPRPPTPERQPPQSWPDLSHPSPSLMAAARVPFGPWRADVCGSYTHPPASCTHERLFALNVGSDVMVRCGTSLPWLAASC
jgi:hypothetical protein